jgi:ATP-dependent Clp protease ATP-binding subunit ClpC
LLDEFEKADPWIWDLFLQVFDAGRITDSLGRVVDFRRTLIIATSNLGASRRGESIGFVRGARSGRDHAYQSLMTTVLRPELLNRFDRIVPFQSLSPESVRKIVRREIDALLERRGLQRRAFTLDVDDKAIAFLVAQGYSETFGARSVRRIVERHLAGPLSTHIVSGAANATRTVLITHDEGGDQLDVRLSEEAAAETGRRGPPP